MFYLKENDKKIKDNLPTLRVQANTKCRIFFLEAIQSFWKL